MDQGLLTPDDLVIDMFMDRLAQLRTDQGFVLDGFPRTMAQAVALDEALRSRGKSIDVAINITGPDEVLVERMLNRAKDSGRADDTPEAIKKRLEVQKPPADLLGHYRNAGKLKDVDGTPDIETVTASIARALGLEAGTRS
jgi:adenylate kinase